MGHLSDTELMSKLIIESDTGSLDERWARFRVWQDKVAEDETAGVCGASATAAARRGKGRQGRGGGRAERRLADQAEEQAQALERQVADAEDAIRQAGLEEQRYKRVAEEAQAKLREMLAATGRNCPVSRWRTRGQPGPAEPCAWTCRKSPSRGNCGQNRRISKSNQDAEIGRRPNRWRRRSQLGNQWSPEKRDRGRQKDQPGMGRGPIAATELSKRANSDWTAAQHQQTEHSQKGQQRMDRGHPATDRAGPGLPGEQRRPPSPADRSRPAGQQGGDDRLAAANRFGQTRQQRADRALQQQTELAKARRGESTPPCSSKPIWRNCATSELTAALKQQTELAQLRFQRAATESMKQQTELACRASQESTGGLKQQTELARLCLQRIDHRLAAADRLRQRASGEMTAALKQQSDLAERANRDSNCRSEAANGAGRRASTEPHPAALKQQTDLANRVNKGPAVALKNHTELAQQAQREMKADLEARTGTGRGKSPRQHRPGGRCCRGPGFRAA